VPLAQTKCERLGDLKHVAASSFNAYAYPVFVSRTSYTSPTFAPLQRNAATWNRLATKLTNREASLARWSLVAS